MGPYKSLAARSEPDEGRIHRAQRRRDACAREYMNHEQNDVATARDFLREGATRWLALQCIETLPQFHRICRRIVENDDGWIRENREEVQKIRGSPEVRLFLIKQGGAGLISLMHEVAEAIEPEVRDAAWEALSTRNLWQEVLEPVVDTFKVMDEVDRQFGLLGRNGWTLPLYMDMRAFRRFHSVIVDRSTTVQDIKRWFVT